MKIERITKLYIPANDNNKEVKECEKLYGFMKDLIKEINKGVK